MITTVHTNKMVVFSDLHLGNPFCSSKRKILQFLRWAAQEGYDICINGDGFDIAQISFEKMTHDIPEFLHTIKLAAQHGRSIYYVVGNHDIALENFIADWGGIKMAPFLNLQSGNTRIRVEHGHLYDPLFVKNPRLYEWLTGVAGIFLSWIPNLYKLWIRYEKLLYNRYQGERKDFAIAAHELTERGFDAVIFGHTHHVSEREFPDEGKYFNPGSWLLGTSYVEILNGKITLKKWQEHSTLSQSKV